MNFRRHPEESLGAGFDPTTGVSPELFARIEAAAREIARRIERERAMSEELMAELGRAPIETWPALAVSGRFSVPTFLEAACTAAWSLPADRSEALAKFGYEAACRLDPGEVGTATAEGLIAVSRATLGDAWRRLGRLAEADLAFLAAFGDLAQNEDAIDLGIVEALHARLLRDSGEFSWAYLEALRAARHLRREGIAPLAAGAWGEVAALAAEIGACGRVDSALDAARRETGAAAQNAAANAVARGVLRLLLLRRVSAAVALACAALHRLAPDRATRRAFVQFTVQALADHGKRTEGFRAPAARKPPFTPLSAHPRPAVASSLPNRGGNPMTDPDPIVPPTDDPASDGGDLLPLRDPSRWEEVEGYRQTFLIHFTQPGAAAALQKAAGKLYDDALESAHAWPRSPLPPVIEQAQAGASECRYLEGFFGMVAREGEESSLSRGEIRISALASGYAAAAGELAARIERDLDSVAGEDRPSGAK